MKTPDKIAKLYHKTVLIEFFEASHRYKMNGERVSGVTTFTGVIDKSAPLLYWATGLTENYLIQKIEEGVKIGVKHIQDARWQYRARKDEAADLGSQVHKLAEDYINAKLSRKKVPEIDGEEMDERVYKGYLAFVGWVNDHNVRFKSTEELVCSRRHKYVGLLDVIFTLGSEKHKVEHIGDFKTGKPKEHKRQKNGRWVTVGISPYPEHRYQVSAYQAAKEEESSKAYGSKWIMYFSKDDAEFRAFSIPASEHKQDFKAFLSCKNIKERGNQLNL